MQTVVIARQPEPSAVRLSRRQLLLRTVGVAVGIRVLGQAKKVRAQAPGIVYTGNNLRDWTLTVGDGVYAAPGEAPITLADIETLHYKAHSELRANLARRSIMVHNLMYKKIIDPSALDYLHVASYEFRLPFIPTKGNHDLNAQTLEGGLSLWEGVTARLNYNVAFQWILNPYGDFGAIRVWTGTDGAPWHAAGSLPVDTAWHRVQFMLDYQRQSASLAIDDQAYAAVFAVHTGTAAWGHDISATTGAEIISIFPGSAVPGALHIAEFRDWRWEWTPSAHSHTFLPFIAHN